MYLYMNHNITDEVTFTKMLSVIGLNKLTQFYRLITSIFMDDLTPSYAYVSNIVESDFFVGLKSWLYYNL